MSFHRLHGLLKPIAIASTLVALGATAPAMASQTYNGTLGGLSLTLSADLTQALDAIGIAADTVAGGTSTNTPSTATTSDGVSTVQVVTNSSPVTAATADGLSLQSVQAAGSSLVLTRGTAAQTVTLSNFDFDPTSEVLYADITTTQGNYLHQSFLVASSNTTVTGTPASLTANGTILSTDGTVTNLVFSTDASSGTSATSILRQGWGLPTILFSTLSTATVGDIKTQLAIATPEPSTYALVGLGLVAASAVARRRRATV